MDATCPRPPLPPARSRAPLLGNTPPRRWRPQNPAGSARAHAGTQGRPRGPDVEPTPLLSACRARQEAEPRPLRRAACGTHESRSRHRPARRRAANRHVCDPCLPGRPAAGAEAATAGVAAEAAAGAGPCQRAAPGSRAGLAATAPGGGRAPGWAEWPPPRAVAVTD